jgi:hypothetical protein
MGFVFTLVATIGAFDGEPFPVIAFRIAATVTLDAADIPFFIDGDARSTVGYGRETGENMLT